MSAPALRIAGLSHRYGARLALDGVSLNVAPGEFRVLLGPNGAGKSTLYGLLTRLLACQSGAIELFGQPLSAPAMAGLGVVFQQPTLDLDLTVEQNLAYFAALHGLRGSERRARITVGDPMDEKTTIGPMISQAHLAKVRSYIELGPREGATLD